MIEGLLFSRTAAHHVRLQTGHQLTDARLQAVLHPLHLLQGRVGQNLAGERGLAFSQRFGGHEEIDAVCYAALRSAGTFWILVFMADGMVVGGMNWKVGAALLGY